MLQDRNSFTSSYEIGGVEMATSSIFQNVMIKDKKSVSKFVHALEQSRTTRAKDVTYSRPVEVVEDSDMIRKMFGDQTDDRVQDSDD